MDSPDLTRAAWKLRRWREARGMTQAALAALYRVSRKQVVTWEAGGAVASRSTMERLHRDGVCEPNDWFEPATCTLCDRALADAATASCTLAGCPLPRTAADAALPSAA